MSVRYAAKRHKDTNLTIWRIKIEKAREKLCKYVGAPGLNLFDNLFAYTIWLYLNRDVIQEMIEIQL